jgi:hypothetical protein
MTGKEPSYFPLIEPLFDVVDFSDAESFTASVQPFTQPVVQLFACHLALAEVYNGGFLQLFWTGTGILVPEAVDGFRMLDMPQLAGTVHTAATLLGTPYPRDRDDRWDALLAATDRPEGELDAIFMGQTNLYTAFNHATQSLPLTPLSEQAWRLATDEHGGFQFNADTLATKIRAGFASAA